MRTCKTCKWWQKMAVRDRVGACDFVNTVHANRNLTSVQLGVRVWDDTGLEVWLETGEDFGCVHHAPAAPNA